MRVMAHEILQLRVVGSSPTLGVSVVYVCDMT